MAREDCAVCRGTGWKLVARKDGTPGNVAVACECGMEERAGLVMERARIPKRYEHCDFESYATDLADGKTWTSEHEQSLKQAKLLMQGFVREYPATEKGLLLMGPSGVGKTHLAVAGLKELIRRGHGGLFCDYRELLKRDSGELQPGERIHGDGGPGAGADSGATGAGRSGGEQAFRCGCWTSLDIGAERSRY